MPTAAMIGSGLIGRAWASVFARAGWNVKLYDAAPGAAEAALKLVGEGLEEQARHGLVKDAKVAAARVSVARSVAEAVQGADFVQENTPEVLEAKIMIFAEMDELAAPHVVLASSTSAIVASKYTENLKGRARCLVAHPVNPPHLIPLVELVGAPWTSPETIARAKAVYEQIGQVPIVVNKEIEGFILNRLQGALLAEAFRLVGEGYVSPQDCDKTLKDGLGLRWSFMGPFETIDLNAPGGMADYCARYTGFYRRLQAEPAKASVFEGENVESILKQWGLAPDRERLEARMAWRDKRLAALAAHKSSQADS
ncbi:L-carnitine dehydrogenase [Variibacter gotjawalensis]|uniref:L-carnitine dehydrogenase n=1 Tax=Variibacter gotjawalensis TaxID=1333996 RepID=A0A0S3Q0I7_9BRAD|nr:3-hydroxyacyl-CoA dehydrogenase [Variibacter gotjawalensis]NIK47535.1 3-hydroxyacyl-CoA dehydrogenase [Variibacter gotjawalensis]RZS49432.1 3-hydroxyacyl-CoA dehydrogenase [Variibacter gotjawalensis]BAT61695.1 L-carnitine dehydrogenase [Variibacter gotjawalensis]